MRLKVSAKINLYLDILSARSDGYHELSMIMQSVDLYDFLTIRPSEALGIECEESPGEANIAHKAAALFYDSTRIAKRVHINIEKNIPARAGLGGGSANAAATLYGLNELYGHPCSDAELAALAVRIGADVPFFLEGGCQLSHGIGEVLKKISNPLNCTYLLVQPDGEVDTAQAYALYDEVGGEHGQLEKCLAALSQGDLNSFFANTGNALTRAALRLCPSIASAQDFLARHTPHFFMTGSGSACVGIFQDSKRASAALAEGKKKFKFAALCRNADPAIERIQ